MDRFFESSHEQPCIPAGAFFSPKNAVFLKNSHEPPCIPAGAFFSPKIAHPNFGNLFFASGRPPLDRSRRDMQNDGEIMRFEPLKTHFVTIFDFLIF